jgi:phage tail-like protein
MAENPNSSVTNPITASQFALDVQGITAYFTEASGFENKTDVVVFVQQDAKGKRIYQKLPGNTNWSDVTLKRGHTADQALWTWRKQVLDGDIQGARKNGTITGYDTKGNPVIQYTFQRGWISSWKASAYNAKTNEAAVEEITLAHEGIDRTL